MPDNTQVPGSAASSAGSTTTGQTPSAGGAAASPGVPADDLTARLQALTATVNQIAQGQENLRSLHDRQMNELRRTVTTRPARQARSADDAGGDGNGDGAGNAPVPHRGNTRYEQEMALIKFRQLNPDWAEYWGDMEPILSDPYRAAPFAVHSVDPDTGEPYVDYYRSVEFLKTKLERDRLAALKTEFDKTRADANTRRDAARTTATISGGGAASGPESPDWSKMSSDEKIRKLYEMDPSLFDPNDLPAALRKKK